MIDRFLNWLFTPPEQRPLIDSIVEQIQGFDSISNHGLTPIDAENGALFVLIKRDRHTYKDKMTIRFGINKVWIHHDTHDYPFFMFEQEEINAIRQAIISLHNKEVQCER